MVVVVGKEEEWTSKNPRIVVTVVTVATKNLSQFVPLPFLLPAPDWQSMEREAVGRNLATLTPSFGLPYETTLLVGSEQGLVLT